MSPEINNFLTFLVTGLFLAFVSFASFIIFMLEKHLGIISLFFHKVDPESKCHGGELVAEVLKSHGVKWMFTLVGGHVSPVLVAAEKIGIRVVDTRHEVSAVFAADAVARLSGTVGVAVVTAGPGVTNTITAVKNAQMAESPVLIIGGASATLLKGRGSLQDIDQISLFKSICKFCISVKTVREIIPALQKAILAAVSDTPGPVFIELPIDVLYPYHVVSKEFQMKGKPKNFVQKITNWYLQTYLNNVFAGAWEKTDVTPLSPRIPLPTDETVQKCAELISKSKKPVILVGSQATLPPVSADELRAALEELGIPCFLGGMARGLLGRNSPLHIRQHRKEALQEADLVLLAGSVCDFRLSYGRILSRKSKVIAVNRDKAQMLKNSDIFWKPVQAVQSDVGSFMVQIVKQLKGYKYDDTWLQLLQNRDKEKEMKNRKMAEDLPETHLNPLKILYHLEEVLDDDSVLVADGGDFVGSAAYILRPRGPLKWLDPGAFGTLGVGGGFALGAKLCRPESEVWIIYGDGSCGYSIAEIDTFVRHKLPVLAIVGNDAGWTQISREQVPMFGSNVACGLQHTDYHHVAEGYGGKGLLLERKHNESIVEVLKKAQQLYKEGNSVLINALIGKSKFREGSISV